MASPLADLLVKMDVDSAKYHEKLDKMGEHLGKFGKAADQLNHVVQEAFTFEFLKEAAEKLFEFMEKGVSAAVKVGRLAQVAGTTTEEMSRLSYAARMSGVDADQLGGAFARLSRTMVKGAEGHKEQAQAFALLGVKTTEAGGKLRATEDVMMGVADAFEHMKDGPAKAALAIAIFGRTGAELIPFLNQGSEKIKELGKESDALGLTIEGKTSVAAKEFHHNMTRLNLVSEGLAVQVAKQLAPVMNNLMHSFIEGGQAQEFMAKTSQVLGVAIKSLITIGASVVTVFRMIVDELSGLVGAAVFAFKGEWANAWGELKRAVKDPDKDFIDEGIFLHGLWDAASNVESHKEELSDKIDAPIFRATEKADQAKKQLQSIIDSLGAKMAELQFTPEKKSEGAKMKFEIEQGKLKDPLAELAKTNPKLAEEFKDRLLTVAYGYDILKASAEGAADGLQKQAQRMTEGKSLNESSLTPLEKYEKAQAHLLELVTHGAITWETYAREIHKVHEEFQRPTSDDEYVSALEKRNRRIERLNEEMAQGMNLDVFAKKRRNINKDYQEQVSPTDLLDPLDAYNRKIDELNEKMKDGLDPKLYAKATKRALVEYQDALDQMSGLASKFSSGVSQILENGLVDNFKGGIKSMYSAFVDMVRKIIAQLLVMRLMKGLGLTPGGGAYGWLAGTGNDLSGGPKAAGGDVSLGKTYLIGEKGPELFTPNMSGHITPNDKIGAVAGKQTVEHIHRFDDKYMSMTFQEAMEHYIASEAAKR